MSIDNGIRNLKEYGESKKENLTNDAAFNLLAIQYLCFQSKDFKDLWYDMRKCSTDGSNDGGIDFVFFNDEENKVIIGQSKSSKNVSVGEFASEISKVIKTLSDFREYNTGSYKSSLKDNLQNALDRLNEDKPDNIDIYFVSRSDFNEEKALEKVAEYQKKVNDIRIVNSEEFTEIIEKINTEIDVVTEFSFEMDIANNYLEYNSDVNEGIVTNISSNSIARAYDKFHTKGLFDLNIRRYIRNKRVDEGIKETLDRERENFWFYNNGLTIACDDYRIDGNILKLYKFSIVNGGQTTTLIGTYKGSNKEEFFVPCKIIKSDTSNNNGDKFFNKVAEATNSQKPIQPRDLKSNSREMIGLMGTLAKWDIDFVIKRGQAKSNKSVKINNDLFGQIFNSFVNQKPGSSRSNKRSIFDNNSTFSSIFSRDFNQKNLQEFTVDLIELNERFDILTKKFKGNMSEYFTDEKANVFNNAKTTLFALFGIVYSLINDDISAKELLNAELKDIEIKKFGGFISNYKDDDIEEKLKDLIMFLVDMLEEEYTSQYNKNTVTSISNFFKTDKKYQNSILKNFTAKMQRTNPMEEIISYGIIFKRN